MISCALRAGWRHHGARAQRCVARHRSYPVRNRHGVVPLVKLSGWQPDFVIPGSVATVESWRSSARRACGAPGFGARFLPRFGMTMTVESAEESGTTSWQPCAGHNPTSCNSRGTTLRRVIVCLTRRLQVGLLPVAGRSNRRDGIVFLCGHRPERLRKTCICVVSACML